MTQRCRLLCLGLSLGLLRPAPAVAARGEASLDLRARAGGGTRLRLHEARGSLQAPLGGHWEFYADAGMRNGEGLVSESYAEYRSRGTRLRLGRLFLPIGIHSRSELYYTGFVELPFVKYWPFNGFVAFRSEQGVTLSGGSPCWRYELGLLGGDGSEAILGLDDPKDVTLRVQSYRGGWIVGINGYTGTARARAAGGDVERRAARLAGLDWRYSAPGWIVRGEWWTGRLGGGALDGGYLDLLYHPAGLPAWTFVLRGEAVHWRGAYRLGTVGAKFVPAPGWGIHLNWIETDYGGEGLRAQVLRTVEF